MKVKVDAEVKRVSPFNTETAHIQIEMEEQHRGWNVNVPAIPKGHIVETINAASKHTLQGVQAMNKQQQGK